LGDRVLVPHRVGTARAGTNFHQVDAEAEPDRLVFFSRRLLRKRSLGLQVLFVCTGNICRSPTAERIAALFNRDQFQIPDFVVSSAGTRAVIGGPIHRNAATVLRGLGAETTDFAARQLTPRIASSSDLIIAMTGAHRDIVLETAPRQLRKTFTLTEAARLATIGADTIADLAALRPHLVANDIADIPDPIGHRPEVFAAVGAQIAELLPPILELCRRLVRE
jgi:protein-tyrosine phosphatase